MTRTRLRSFLVAAIAITLVLAQALAWMHRVVHAPHAGGLQATSSLQQAHDSHWTHDLFAGHDESSCRVADAATQACAPSAQALAVLAPPSAWIALSLGEALARRAALAQARGPPVSVR